MVFPVAICSIFVVIILVSNHHYHVDIGSVDSSELAQLEAARGTHFWTRVLGITSIFGLVIASFAAYGVWRTVTATRDTLKISQKTLDVQRDTQIDTLKPYFSVEEFSVSNLEPDADTNTATGSVTFYLKNNGATPAYAFGKFVWRSINIESRILGPELENQQGYEPINVVFKMSDKSVTFLAYPSLINPSERQEITCSFDVTVDESLSNQGSNPISVDRVHAVITFDTQDISTRHRDNCARKIRVCAAGPAKYGSEPQTRGLGMVSAVVIGDKLVSRIPAPS